MDNRVTEKNISTGQGERLRQTAGGVTTNYTVDLNAGLSQVLADGSYTYLYGSSRLAQYGADGAEYFLTDALGSVRQVVDAAGAVILSKDYRPYGEVLSSQGQGTTSYGFAGEFTSSLTGQSYLRARWYAPSQGRFISRDTWEGDYNRPNSLNRWNYAYSNPIRYKDPTGEDPISDCIALLSLVVVDGPIPVGDAAAVAGCIAILGGSAYAAYIASQHAPDAAVECENWVEWLYNLPESPNSDPNPSPAPQPQPIPIPSPGGPRPPETPRPSVRVRHYSDGIKGIMNTVSVFNKRWCKAEIIVA